MTVWSMQWSAIDQKFVLIGLHKVRRLNNCLISVVTDSYKQQFSSSNFLKSLEMSHINFHNPKR